MIVFESIGYCCQTPDKAHGYAVGNHSTHGIAVGFRGSNYYALGLEMLVRIFVSAWMFCIL